MITADMKHSMMVAAMNMAYSGLPFDEFAKEESQNNSRQSES